MPTVEILLTELENLMQYKLPRELEALNEIFAYVKGEVTNQDEERIDLEIKDSNHPDLWGIEGVSRALKGYLKIEQGLKRYSVAKKSEVKISVDAKLENIRPYIACAIAKGVKLTDEALKGLMHLQDKIDQTYGRGRRRTSIGLYDFNLIKPPVHYTVSKPNESSFVPLGFEEKLTLKQIIEKHPKGIDYGYIIKRYDVWPLLKDNEAKILSLPPIINSNDLGRITEDTENILVEITGTREDTVSDALTIICTTLADRGGKIESVEVDYPYSGGRTVKTPILSTTGTKLAANYVNKTLGVELTLNQIATLLKKSRFGVKRIGGQELHVEVPCYRKDILHPIDIVEDVAIAYNLNQVPTRWPPFQTFGALTSKTRFKNFLRSLAVGYGLQEIISFSLTNEDNLFRRMNLPKSEVIEVDNPKTPLYTSVRTWMIPSLMDFLQHNTHYEYPQRIFEIGECVSPNGKDKPEVEEQSKIGITTAHKEACFTEVKSILDSFMINLGIKAEIVETQHNSFIEGRVGKILMKDIEIGVLGELSPIVLENWNLTVPVSALEMKITIIAERYKT